jgi:hypothetical protein
MRHKLLIVDDDEAIRTQMKWALTQDYDIAQAEDRISAVSTFKAEFPIRRRLFEIGIRRRYHASVGLDLLPSPHPLEGLLLKKPQELHLNGRRQIPDFVQEQGAARSCLDETLALHVRTGK